MSEQRKDHSPAVDVEFVCTDGGRHPESVLFRLHEVDGQIVVKGMDKGGPAVGGHDSPLVQFLESGRVAYRCHRCARPRSWELTPEGMRGWYDDYAQTEERKVYLPS